MRVSPRTRLGALWRALLALVIVVVCAAAATATAGLLAINDAVRIINVQKPVRVRHLVLPAPGAPQTLLLIGVDHRYGQGQSPGNTDTMMLVRVDDRSTTINALSIPRDLAVQVPGYGVEKINAAYSEGGPSLLLATLRADVIPNLQVNHLLLVDFASFANLINAIGCVYAQVDQRYYNHSIGPADSTTNYSSIDIQPGYQRMCGGSGADLGGANTALAFVRFRHNDTDFVRQARQQDFLRWAKQGFNSSRLLSDRTQLLTDFAKDVQSDSLLHSTDGLIELFDLAINADGSRLKSIPFPYTGYATINGEDDVTFSQAAAQQAYREFMTPTRPPRAGSGAPSPPGQAGARRRGRRRRGAGPAPGPYRPPSGMVADIAAGRQQAAALGAVGLPVYYPRYIPADFTYCLAAAGNCDIGYEPASAYSRSYPRRYEIVGPSGVRYRSYVMTLVLTSGGATDLGTGEYANVQATTWPGGGHAAGPPILREPTAERTVNGRLLYEYSQGGSLAVVAWKTARAVCWIANTLQNNIPNDQMIAMAASFVRAP